MELRKFEVTYYFTFNPDRLCHCFLCHRSDSSVRKHFRSKSIEIVSVSDVSDDFPISLFKVSNALSKDGFGEKEIAFITSALDLNRVGSFDIFTAD